MLADLLFESLGTFAERDETGALRAYCEAQMEPIEWLYALAGEDEGASWQTLFDADRCPAHALPYLAQFRGVEVDASFLALTEAEKREAIKRPAGFRRGAKDPLAAAVTPYLTGSKRLIVREREPDATTVYVRTLASETPNPAFIANLLRNRYVPAWLNLNYAASAGFTYTDLDVDFSSYSAVDTAYSTYDDIAAHTL